MRHRAQGKVPFLITALVSRESLQYMTKGHCMLLAERACSTLRQPRHPHHLILPLCRVQQARGHVLSSSTTPHGGLVSAYLSAAHPLDTPIHKDAVHGELFTSSF